MTKEFYKEKTEKMLEDLLVKMHQDINTGRVSISDVELLRELNYIRDYLNQNN